MKVNNAGGTNGVRDGSDRAEKTYWRVVNLVWLLLVAMILLAMYLLIGPEFWREFFK